MDDKLFGERFDRIEKRLDDGFTHVQGLIDALANMCAREFTNISERFTAVDGRLNVIEGKLEVFARRVDNEVEERHVLGERVSKLEKAV